MSSGLFGRRLELPRRFWRPLKNSDFCLKNEVMESAWKVVEHVRDGDQVGAWQAAQLLASAVLEERTFLLAAEILRGGPHSLRPALELAELIDRAGPVVDHERAGTKTAP
jgi:hypothetical protein